MGIIYTICFMFRDNHGVKEVCLGKKLRGFRKGTLNGSGGKIKSGETVKACAERETNEEFGVNVVAIEKVGEVLFYDPDLTHECHVFMLKDWTGEPHQVINEATGEAEMDPAWYPVEAIPYELMGTADPHWMVPLLRGEKFRASFHYDVNNQMYDPKIEILPQEFVFE